jgi:heme ABC exporter ATP-binding subunit CcmA
MLSINQVYKSFNRYNVLRGISFTQKQGEIIALMGNNGSGKTTLLRIIARIMKSDSGTISFQENDLLSNNSLHRKDILYIGHDPGMYSYLTAKENLHFSIMLRREAVSNIMIEESLERYELSHFMNEPIAVFSKGMLQKLKLAHAELISWKLLLFDEPFTGLDQSGIDLVDRLINKWKNKNKSVIMVLHNEKRAEEYAHTKLLINSGRIDLG